MAWTSALVAVFAGWLLLSAFLEYEATKGWTPEKVEQLLDEELPAGSPRQQVQDWLDSRQFPNGLSTPDKSGPWAVEAAGLKPRDVAVELQASVPNPNVDWGGLGGTGRMSLTLFFDRNDKLLGHTSITFPTDSRETSPWKWPLLVGWWLLTASLLVLSGRAAFLVWQRHIQGRVAGLRPPWMTRQRVLIALACVVVGSLAFLIAYSDLSRRGPYWDKYQQVRYDMTQDEVEAILGPPQKDLVWGGIGADKECTWEEGEQSIDVTFSAVRDGQWRVQNKCFYPRSAWERLRDFWRGFVRGWF